MEVRLVGFHPLPEPYPQILD